MSFDEHINSEHNMWHYLYFIVLLKVKDTTEFTGPESYVSLMVKVRHSCVLGSKMRSRLDKNNLRKQQTFHDVTTGFPSN